VAAIVAEREERPVRHFVGILDLGALRLRRAMRFGEEAQPSVDVKVPVVQLHRLAGDRDDTFHVGDLCIDGRVEHDDVAGLRRAEAVVDLAHEHAVVLQQRRFHAALTDLGHLYHEQVEDDGDDDRERERLDDLEDGPPRERCIAHGLTAVGLVWSGQET